MPKQSERIYRHFTLGKIDSNFSMREMEDFLDRIRNEYPEASPEDVMFDLDWHYDDVDCIEATFSRLENETEYSERMAEIEKKKASYAAAAAKAAETKRRNRESKEMGRLMKIAYTEYYSLPS